MNNNVRETIKKHYGSLSHGQKKVAEFFIHHLDEAALLTAFQIGKKTGVSETTVIRLSYALGFRGYSQMQESIRKNWLAEKKPTSNSDTSRQDNTQNKIQHVFEKEKSILNQLPGQLHSGELWNAAKKLIKADRIFIGGFGSSFSASYWLYYALKQMRPNVSSSSETGFLLEDICELGKNSAAVIFSFPRYRKEAILLADAVKEQQAPIIALTNRHLSPLGHTAEITLTTEEQMNAGHHSIASVICLTEMLIAGIQSLDQEAVSSRQQKLEQLYAAQNLFLE
ncbi:MurR/RpiR family transcriptional regulator [Alteribacillus sp. HJP-4]|uniref:MurR/RpiR family transcriptional regulator n=1 Tax=Alteribacillus sp. HJP-4 TaxID=2775394 RepID=UPI0035CCE760